MCQETLKTTIGIFNITKLSANTNSSPAWIPLHLYFRLIKNYLVSNNRRIFYTSYSDVFLISVKANFYPSASKPLHRKSRRSAGNKVCMNILAVFQVCLCFSLPHFLDYQNYKDDQPNAIWASFVQKPFNNFCYILTRSQHFFYIRSLRELSKEKGKRTSIYWRR